MEQIVWFYLDPSPKPPAYITQGLEIFIIKACGHINIHLQSDFSCFVIREMIL